MHKNNARSNSSSSYTLKIQLGIICSLLFFIAATKINLKSSEVIKDDFPHIDDYEVINLPPVIPQKIPAPQRPNVVNIVQDDVILEVEDIKFDEFEINGPLYELPKPPVEDLIDDEILEFVSIMPKMKGGMEKLYEKIKYPTIAQKTGIEGRVIVEFIVNKKGEVKNPKIIRGIGGGCDEEVLKAIQLMSFTPGIQNNAFVNVRVHQSVNFKLQN